MTTAPAVVPRRRPGRNLPALGVGLSLLGVAAYVVQMLTGRLVAPYYLPAAATLGLALVAISLWQARTLWRVLALLPVLPIAAVSWMLVLGTRAPAYDGPVRVGEPFPAFTTARADGTPFTEADLRGDRENVLVFF